MVVDQLRRLPAVIEAYEGRLCRRAYIAAFDTLARHAAYWRRLRTRVYRHVASRGRGMLRQTWVAWRWAWVDGARRTGRLAAAATRSYSFPAAPRLDSEDGDGWASQQLATGIGVAEEGLVVQVLHDGSFTLCTPQKQAP